MYILDVNPLSVLDFEKNLSPIIWLLIGPFFFIKHNFLILMSWNSGNLCIMVCAFHVLLNRKPPCLPLSLKITFPFLLLLNLWFLTFMLRSLIHLQSPLNRDPAIIFSVDWAQSFYNQRDRSAGSGDRKKEQCGSWNAELGFGFGHMMLRFGLTSARSVGAGQERMGWWRRKVGRCR